MTLGIVILTKDDSFVIASDKRVTGGTQSMTAHADSAEKIHKITDKCGMTIAGDAGTAVTIIDLFLKETKLELVKRNSLEISVTDVAEIFRKTAVEYYTRWFKDMTMREWVLNVKEDIIPYFRILLAGYDPDDSDGVNKCKIIEMSSYKRFAPDNITGNFGAAGITTIAQYLLYRFYTTKQEEASAAGLAAFCISETNSQDDAVGDEFQIASFSKHSPFKFYSDSELSKIKRRCAELKTELQLALVTTKRVKEEQHVKLTSNQNINIIKSHTKIPK